MPEVCLGILTDLQLSCTQRETASSSTSVGRHDWCYHSTALESQERGQQYPMAANGSSFPSSHCHWRLLHLHFCKMACHVARLPHDSTPLPIFCSKLGKVLPRFLQATSATSLLNKLFEITYLILSEESRKSTWKFPAAVQDKIKYNRR